MDLLDKLGGKDTSSQHKTNTATTTSAGVDPTRGSDLIAKAPVTEVNTSATSVTGSASAADPAGKIESSAGSATVSDPNSWTLENALKEVKKLREENKSVRLKYEENLDRLKSEVDTKVKTVEEKYKSSLDAAKELEEVKAREADKKRDIAEKLAHREALLAETSTKMEMLKQQYEGELSKLREKAASYEAQQQAEMEVYKKRIEEELSIVPQKFRTHAELLVKGAGDYRDALLVLQEAKIGGLFEDRTVVVNHSVPGAQNGARVTTEQLKTRAREEFERMSPSQKIAAALKEVRSGTANSAFTTKK